MLFVKGGTPIEKCCKQDLLQNNLLIQNHKLLSISCPEATLLYFCITNKSVQQMREIKFEFERYVS